MAERDKTVGMIENSYGEWFGDLAAGAEISEVWRSERAQSALVRYEISDGLAVRSVMVKRNSLTGDVAERPRLGLRSGFESKHRLEAAALAAIHRSVPENDGFGSVRVLEIFADGLILETVEGRDLGSILRRTHGIGAAVLVRRSGELLRSMHRASLDVPTARGSGNDLARSFEEFLHFLGPELRADPALADRLDRIAAALPDLDHLSVGLGHGDFAPRNLLVGDGQRLTILDPLGCQLVPVEEDLAYFALALRTGALVPWLGPISERVASDLEGELLAGYGTTSGFRYHAVCTLVALDAMAADKVRPVRRSGMAKRLVTQTLPGRTTLVNACAARAIEAIQSGGVDG